MIDHEDDYCDHYDSDNNDDDDDNEGSVRVKKNQFFLTPSKIDFLS